MFAHPSLLICSLLFIYSELLFLSIRVRFANYCLFILILSIGMLGLVAGPDGSPVPTRAVGVFSNDSVNNTCFLWCLVMSLWFLLDEIAEFRRYGYPVNYTIS